jgi:hypothetical protein
MRYDEVLNPAGFTLYENLSLLRRGHSGRGHRLQGLLKGIGSSLESRAFVTPRRERACSSSNARAKVVVARAIVPGPNEELAHNGNPNLEPQ